MTRREKNLFFVFAGLVGLAVLGALLYFVILGPLWQIEENESGLRTRVFTKEQQIQTLLRDRELIKLAKERSLPLQPHQANIEYLRYLNNLVKGAKLEKHETKLLTNLDAKIGGGAGAKGKKAAHTVLSYQVRAEGTLDKVVTFLKDMQETPVLHRVKRISLDRKDLKDRAGRLSVMMEIDALIFNDVPQNHSPEFTSSPKKKMDPPGTNPERLYASLGSKNFFLGYLRPLPPLAKKEDKEEKPALVATFDVRNFVRLDYFLPAKGEAYMRNQLETRRPQRLLALKGFNYIRINSESGKRLVDGTVLRIDHRDLYFSVGDKYYCWHVGQSLAEAMARSLPYAELKALGLVKEVDTGAPEKEGKDIP